MLTPLPVPWVQDMASKTAKAAMTPLDKVTQQGKSTLWGVGQGKRGGL